MTKPNVDRWDAQAIGELDRLFNTIKPGNFLEKQVAQTIFEQGIRAGNIEPEGFLSAESITEEMFTTILHPTYTVDTLPTLPNGTYAEGQIVFLTTNGSVYVNVGDEWVSLSDQGPTVDDLVTTNRLILYANRGDLKDDGDTGDSWPEDSLEGFQQAMVKGVDGVEIDVGVSSAGTLYAMHDTTLNRTTNLSGNITSASDATLNGGHLDAGYGYNASRHGSSVGIPTVASIVEACEPYEPIYLFELKTATATQMADFVVDQGIEGRSIIVTGSTSDAADIKDISLRIHVMMNEGTAGEGDDNVEWLSWDYNDVVSLAAVEATAPQRPHSYIPIAEFSTADETTVLTDMFDRGVRSWETYDASNALDARRHLVYGVILDHGDLTGLLEDDHTQYTKKATLTTTGDIYYASAAETPARRGIGSDGQVLTVSAGVPAWATPSASSGLGEILIVDTPSTPLIFADLVQNDDQTDLVYADP